MIDLIPGKLYKLDEKKILILPVTKAWILKPHSIFMHIRTTDCLYNKDLWAYHILYQNRIGYFVLNKDNLDIFCSPI